MADFKKFKLTSKGKELLFKLLNGDIIKFSSIDIGDGSVNNDSEIDSLQSVKNLKIKLPTNNQEITNEGYLLISSKFTNEKLNSAFYLREIGLNAIDPESGEEYLFAYTYTDYPDYIPIKDSLELSAPLDIYLDLTNFDTANLTIDNSPVLATIKDFNNYLDAVIKIYKPNIITPIDSSDGLYGSTYQTTDYFFGTQDKMYWNIYDSTGNNVIVSKVYEPNKYGVANYLPVEDFYYSLSGNTSYKAEVRYGSEGHLSEYSDKVSFTTPSILVARPDIIIRGYPGNVDTMPYIETSAFKVFFGTDSHQSTDWIIEDMSGNIVWSSLADTNNLTSIQVPYGILSANTNYKFKVRHNGTNNSSRYSELNVTVKQLNVPMYEVARITANYHVTSLALSGNGNVLVVGDYTKDVGTEVNVGGIYIYRNVNGTWQLEHTIDGPVYVDNNNWRYSYEFGNSVDINESGDTIVVSLKRLNTAIASDVNVFVYKYNGSSWNLYKQYRTPTPNNYDDTNDIVINKVEINSGGNTIAVASNNPGGVYIYDLNNDTLMYSTFLETHLNNSNGIGSSVGSMSISISKDSSDVLAIAFRDYTNQLADFIILEKTLDGTWYESFVKPFNYVNYLLNVKCNNSGDLVFFKHDKQDLTDNNLIEVYRKTTSGWDNKLNFKYPDNYRPSDNVNNRKYFGDSIDISSDSKIVLISGEYLNNAFVYIYDTENDDISLFRGFTLDSATSTGDAVPCSNLNSLGNLAVVAEIVGTSDWRLIIYSN